MTKVTVYHNVDEDAFAGLNRRLGEKDVYYAEASHPLIKVYEYDLEDVAGKPDEYILSHAWETFNIGTSELAGSYRARRLRSLSVGDVIALRSRYWSCESAGWSQVRRQDLNIISDPIAAEHAIRLRYDIWGERELIVTVPL